MEIVPLVTESVAQAARCNALALRGSTSGGSLLIPDKSRPSDLGILLANLWAVPLWKVDITERTMKIHA